MRRRFQFWGFKSSHEVLENSLGSLERDVMTLVWQRGDSNVRDACEQFGSAVAYTTMMTTMDRLFKKGLLTRRKAGRAFVYRAAASRAEVEGAVATCRFCRPSSTRCRIAIARCSTSSSG